jgi:membrane-bound lytic murein transglycosylase MltF
MDLDLGSRKCAARSRGCGHGRTLRILAASGWLAFVACKKPQTTVPAEQMLPNEYDGRAEPVHRTLALPTTFGKRTGDLDEMVKQRTIRALLTIDPINFFYLSGQPHGLQYELLQEFEKFANQKLRTGKLPLRVVFLPMRLDQMEDALTQGLGDFIAYSVMISPEREQRVAFSIPLRRNVSQVVVTGSALGDVTSFERLTGEPIYVNPLTPFYKNLKRVSDLQLRAGKPPLEVRAADKRLYQDSLIEMVNAGLIPATVARGERADLWAQVLPHIKVHPELVIASEHDTAWAMRKNNPRLKQLVDEFLKDHVAGTIIGNTLLRRYLQNTKWVKDSISPEEIRKFIAYSKFFKRYAAEYNCDYLLIAAQGYQESQLNQSKISPEGAVGVMQVLPKVAAASPINISDVRSVDGNIHAGAKILYNIAATHFKDSAIDPLNKTLFAFAAYNAGPTRIADLRKKAARDGLDPNQWFDNVELEVAKDVGEETVIYVGNVYKYYVAYRLTADERKLRGLPGL